MLTILDDAGKQITLDGRIAAIVRWLIARRQRLEAPVKMRMTFDCAGQSVSAEVSEREQVDRRFFVDTL